MPTERISGSDQQVLYLDIAFHDILDNLAVSDQISLRGAG